MPLNNATITNTTRTQKTVKIFFTFQLTGNFPGAAGDPLNFANFASAPGTSPCPFQAPPVAPVVLESTTGSGYTYIYVPGANAGAGAVLVQQGGAAVSSPAALIPTAAYPAGVLADTISGVAEFAFGQ